MKRQITKLLCIAMLAMPVVSTAPAFADPVGGIKSGVARVEAHSTKVFRVRCWAGEITRVTVTGDGDTDLDLYIYDSAGRLVTSDEDPGDFCVVYFTPRFTGEFTIRIVNRGSVYNRCEVVAD